MKKGDEIVVTIAKLVFGGLGIATIEGLKIFVADSVPGDEVKVLITKKKAKFAEGKITDIITPSPKRIQAKCRHFSTCGGCTWQFLSYEDQLLYKQEIVQETIERIGGFTDIPLSPIIGCDTPWNYRNKMEFSFAYDQAGLAEIGLHPKGYHYDVFSLTECFLPSPQYAQIVQILRAWIRKYQISIYEQKSNQGVLMSVVIRHNQKNELLVNIVSRSGKIPHTEELITELEPLGVISLFHSQVHAMKGKPTTRILNLIWGKEFLEESLTLPAPWGTLQFRIYPEAFFQPNPVQAQILYTKALGLAGLTKSDIVLDLYCGTGTLGLFSSKQVQLVMGIDNVPDAIKSAEANALENGIHNASFFVGDAGAVLRNQKKMQPNIVITDPPRSGMTPETIDLLVGLPLKKIVYISCNPTTQARDLKLLCEKGYRLVHVQPVDMFPHTYHIENIVVLEK